MINKKKVSANATRPLSRNLPCVLAISFSCREGPSNSFTLRAVKPCIFFISSPLLFSYFTHNLLFQVFDRIREFMEQLILCIGIGGIAHKNTRNRVIKNRKTEIRATLIQRYAQQVRMILKLRRQMKTKLTMNKQLIKVKVQWIRSCLALQLYSYSLRADRESVNFMQEARQQVSLRFCFMAVGTE